MWERAGEGAGRERERWYDEERIEERHQYHKG
jgi:hypothetical protein